MPRDAAKNTAGVAALALLTALGERRGVALTIRKGLPLSSGLGGSAASAAAAVVAVDAILGSRVSIETLIACALEGERLGAGSAHADNIAPSLCGGLVLVRCPNPPDIVRLPFRGPHLPGRASRSRDRNGAARALVGDTVRLADAVRQWANLGALVDGLQRGDFASIAGLWRHHRGAAAGVARVGLAAIKRAAPMPARSGAVCGIGVPRSSRCARAGKRRLGWRTP